MAEDAVGEIGKKRVIGAARDNNGVKPENNERTNL